MRSPMIVLGIEIELDWDADGKGARVLMEPNRVIGIIHESRWDRELFYSNLLDQANTMQNHLETLVRAANRKAGVA